MATVEYFLGLAARTHRPEFTTIKGYAQEFKSEGLALVCMATLSMSMDKRYFKITGNQKDGFFIEKSMLLQ